MKRLISIVIPAYREENYLADTIFSIFEVVKGMSDRYIFEIIIVNDGSPDGTR
jgi:undecaprenyl-phosphate 4-deoxy-4-formamido-L-arabinose transferase